VATTPVLLIVEAACTAYRIVGPAIRTKVGDRRVEKGRTGKVLVRFSRSLAFVGCSSFR
jgi:hypothetical protein